jgi:hypothetical protein
MHDRVPQQFADCHRRVVDFGSFAEGGFRHREGQSGQREKCLRFAKDGQEVAAKPFLIHGIIGHRRSAPADELDVSAGNPAERLLRKQKHTGMGWAVGRDKHVIGQFEGRRWAGERKKKMKRWNSEMLKGEERMEWGWGSIAGMIDGEDEAYGGWCQADC